MKRYSLIHKSLLSGILMLLLMLFWAWGSGGEPEPVHFVYKAGLKSPEWYHTQARLWREEIERNSTHGEAWKCYYLATEYSFWGQADAQAQKRETLAEILENAGRHVPDSYEYHLLRYRFDRDNMEALEKAYQLQPHNPETYYDFLTYYELNGDSAKVREFAGKLYQSHDISRGLVDYNYNMLMSTAPNAILLTNGDNDTYPGWMLQQAKSIRPDVTVLNISLARAYRDYLARKLAGKDIHIDAEALPGDDRFVPALCQVVAAADSEVPIYVAVTVSPQETRRFSDSLYTVGLAYRYCPGGFDNSRVLAENWEKRFRLDYLKHGWYDEAGLSAPVEQQLNTNYIALLMILQDYHRQRGEQARAEAYAGFAQEIAQKTGRETELKRYMKRINQKD